MTSMSCVRGLFLSASTALVACAAKPSAIAGCGEGTAEQNGVCTLVEAETGSPLPSDTGAPPDTGEDEYVPNLPTAVQVSLSGSIAGYFDGPALGLGACIQIIDRGSLYVLGDADVRAEAEVGEGGLWSIDSVELSQQHGPLMLVADCAESSLGVFPSARFVDSELLKDADQGDHIEGLSVPVLRTDDVDAINEGLSGLPSAAFVWGMFGRVIDSTDQVLSGARVSCVDGVCPTVYPVDDPESDHVFQAPSGSMLDQTSTSGRFLIPGGTINTYVIEHDGFETQTLSAGTGPDIALFQDFRL